MNPKIRVGGRFTAVTIGCALAMLPTGPAQAADWDLDHLPTIDALTLSNSIESWSDPTTFKYSVDTWSVDGSVFDLEQTRHESGETVVTLDADILFEFAKATLPGVATARIGTTVAKAPKGSAVSIGGHTDDIGTDPANLKLSQARAQAVAAAVKAARPDLVLTVKGFGESRPLASNDHASGSAKNRRVEIRFPG